MIGTPGIRNLVLFDANSRRPDVMLVVITTHVLRLIKLRIADPSWGRKYGRASTQALTQNNIIVVLPVWGEHIFLYLFSVDHFVF